MKNTFTLITLNLLFLLFPTSLKAQTSVSGGIYSNSTWTKSNSPYIITSDLIIFSGVTLTIEPGVDIKVDTALLIEIRGTINALGSSSDSIRFRANKPNAERNYWRGLKCTPTGKGYFKHCVFSNSVRALDEINGDVKRCYFKNNETGVQHSEVIVDSSVFESNYLGMNGAYKGTVRNSLFFNNYSACQAVPSVIDCELSDNEFAVSGASEAINCTISNNHIGMLACMAKNKCNIIMNNDTGIYEASAIDPSNKVCSNHYNYVHGASVNINLAQICWCESDSNVIASKIIDGFDNVALGLVSFMPARLCSNSTPVDSLCQNPPSATFEIKGKAELVLYPNPLRNESTLKLPQSNTGSDVFILNALGQVVREYKAVTTAELLIRREDLPAGLYFIQLSGSEQFARLIILE